MASTMEWELTDEGIDGSKGAQAPEYFIHNDRLLETTSRGRGTLYDWPIHIAEKAFITKESAQNFVSVYKEAVQKVGLTLDEEILSNTLEYLDEVLGEKQ